MSVEFQNANRKGFVIVPNELARNSSLKRAAKGLLIELLSHSSGFIITEASLISSGQEGRDAVRRSIKELEDAGFLQRSRIRDENNRFTGIRYIVHDRPVHHEKPSDSHNAGFQSTGSQSAENHTLKKNYLKENQDKKTKEENLLVEDESPTTKIPVTGQRLIYPNTGEPATDEQRHEVFSALVEKLRSSIEANSGRSPRVPKSWMTEIRLLLEADGVNPRDAWNVLVWCQNDSFWKSNILSMSKFRQKYTQLEMRMRSEAEGGSRRKTNAEIGHDLIAKFEAEEARQIANLPQLGATVIEEPLQLTTIDPEDLGGHW